MSNKDPLRKRLERVFAEMKEVSSNKAAGARKIGIGGLARRHRGAKPRERYRDRRAGGEELGDEAFVFPCVP